MEINKLISNLKNKLNENFKISSINIEDKTFLHKEHKSFDNNKFHLKLEINSKELKAMKSIDANRKIFHVLKQELDIYIHSLIIKIN